MMKYSGSIRVVLQKNLLLVLTMVGVLVGLVIGFALRPLQVSDDALMWLGLPGQLYLRLLKMMIVPLIVASVITGTANLEPKSNGKISLVSLVYVFVTNMIGAILGVLVFVMFRPGVTDSSYVNKQVTNTEVLETQDIFADLIRNIIPDNLVESTFRQTQTRYDRQRMSSDVESTFRQTQTRYDRQRMSSHVDNSTLSNGTDNIMKVVKFVEKQDGTNFLGLVFACTIIGMGVAVVGEKARALTHFCEALTNVVVVIIQWFMWTTPIGVFSLIAVAVADIADIGEVMKQVGIFVAAVTTGLVIQQLVVLSGIYFALTRKNPFAFLLSVARPWLIAFASGATVVAMPEMLTICDSKLKTDRRVARFVIPLTVTISANGSAVFISCACLFIANITGKNITAADFLTIGRACSRIPISTARTMIFGFVNVPVRILVSVSAMAIPSVPSASIVTVVMILSSLNIPIEALALLLAVEFFLDRLRTTSSVLSDIICVIVTEVMCRKELKAKPEHDMKVSENHDLEIKTDGNWTEESLPLRDNAV